MQLSGGGNVSLACSSGSGPGQMCVRRLSLSCISVFITITYLLCVAFTKPVELFTESQGPCRILDEQVTYF